MAKPDVVHNVQELSRWRETILANLSRSVCSVKSIIEEESPQEVFSHFKFKKTAIEPLTGEPENLIEAINQSQTYLVSLKAVEYLFGKYPEKSFELNLGNASGYDIKATDGSIIAECFAATSYRSNGKLSADLKRLALNTSAAAKYEFFYASDFTDRNRAYYERKYNGIKIIRFERL